MRRIVLGVVALGLSLAAGLCAAVLLVGIKLSSPALAVIGSTPLSLAGAEVVTIKSNSDALVHGWWVSGTVPGGGAVVLAHGVWSNRLQMVPQTQVLHQQGFSVLPIDLQPDGPSVPAPCHQPCYFTHSMA